MEVKTSTKSILYEKGLYIICALLLVFQLISTIYGNPQSAITKIPVMT